MHFITFNTFGHHMELLFISFVLYESISSAHIYPKCILRIDFKQHRTHLEHVDEYACEFQQRRLGLLPYKWIFLSRNFSFDV